MLEVIVSLLKLLRAFCRHVFKQHEFFLIWVSSILTRTASFEVFAISAPPPIGTLAPPEEQKITSTTFEVELTKASNENGDVRYDLRYLISGQGRRYGVYL